MKIVLINESCILFNDGSQITFDHEQDCCEENYADFKQLDSLARNYDYKFPLRFVPVDDYGFLFGDEERLFFCSLLFRTKWILYARIKYLFQW